MLRAATREDAAAIGRIFLATRDLMTYLPRIPDRDRPLLGRWIVERYDVWVAEVDGDVVGFASLGGDLVEHLYVSPDAQRRGVGAALVEELKRLRPAGLRLWVFQENEGARRFYERHGFRLIELTDGSGNMERVPDALYEWTPSAEAASG